MDMFMNVRNSNKRNIEWESWEGGHCWSQVYHLSLSLSVSLSYVTHMIHVEPRGAGITLTFCVQNTHTHALPTIANKNVSLNPDPTCSGYCTCLFAQSCLSDWHTRCAHLWMLCFLMGCTEICWAKNIYSVLITFIAVGTLCRETCTH